MVHRTALALGSIALLAWGLHLFQTISEHARVRQGQKWATAHQAHVSPSLTRLIDAHFARVRRGGAVIALVSGTWAALAAMFLDLPPGRTLAIVWMAIILIGTWGTTTSVVQLARLSKDHPVGSAAHSRAVSVNDYAPVALRLGSAFAGLMAAAGALLFSFDLIRNKAELAGLEVWGQITVAGLTSLVAAAAVIADWAARRVAALPEPADDAAHLYWQDALRSEAIMQAFSGVPLWGLQTFVVGLGFQTAFSTNLPSVAWLWAFAMCAITLVALVSALDVLNFRKRLWPTLMPGQVLMPGEIPPPRRTAVVA